MPGHVPAHPAHFPGRSHKVLKARDSPDDPGHFPAGKVGGMGRHMPGHGNRPFSRLVKAQGATAGIQCFLLVEIPAVSVITWHSSFPASWKLGTTFINQGKKNGSACSQADSPPFFLCRCTGVAASAFVRPCRKLWFQLEITITSNENSMMQWKRHFPLCNDNYF